MIQERLHELAHLNPKTPTNFLVSSAAIPRTNEPIKHTKSIISLTAFATDFLCPRANTNESISFTSTSILISTCNNKHKWLFAQCIRWDATFYLEKYVHMPKHSDQIKKCKKRCSKTRNNNKLINEIHDNPDSFLTLSFFGLIKFEKTFNKSCRFCSFSVTSIPWHPTRPEHL